MIAIDVTTLEGNAARPSGVRRDTGDAYQAYVPRLAGASGIATSTREVLACKRKKQLRTESEPVAAVVTRGSGE